MRINLTMRELLTIKAALRRATDWFDIGDNGEHFGENWERGERGFIARCERLIDKLARAKEPGDTEEKGCELYALMNRARGLLIDRSVAGTITNEERAHLTLLNAFVDGRIARAKEAGDVL